MSEELDWGPSRPPALSWAGALLLLLAVAQLALVGTAVFLDLDGFLERDADRAVIAAVLGLFALQLLGAVAVLRMWRWWRGIAFVLALAGLALHGVNLAGRPDPPEVVAFNSGMAILFLIVMILLSRGRDR